MVRQTRACVKSIFACVLLACIKTLFSQADVFPERPPVFLPPGGNFPFNSHYHGTHPNDDDTTELPDHLYPVQHAGLPLNLAVNPMPLENSDHELKFNVSWSPPQGTEARDYSLEVRGITNTIDCISPMCYEYNIPGDATWWPIPAYSSSVAETCAVRPGCAYMVQLIAHPWDGHTSANLNVVLDECVAGVCSCAHSPRLPPPIVKAHTLSIHGEIFINVTWTLPPPRNPQRLPPDLRKHSYLVSIGKQMVTDAHPSPWFANTISRQVDSDGLVSEGDTSRFVLLPINDKIDGIKRNGKPRRPNQLVLDVKLLARVNLVDDRGCVGPAGNATAYDPAEATSLPFGAFVVWAIFGGACVLVIAAALVLSKRVVKRVLNAFRPTTSAPLEPLRLRPAWFSLQLRT